MVSKATICLKAVTGTFRSLARRPFVRDVIAVAGGTAGAQAITLAFSPIITRLYGPEAFGIQGVFTSFVAILAPLASLAYPAAMVIAQDDQEANRLAWAALCLAVIFGFSLGLITFFERTSITTLGLDQLGPVIYLLPIAIFCAVLQQVSEQWVIRKQRFRIAGGVAAASAATTNAMKAGLSCISPTAGTLIAISIISSLGTAIALSRFSRWSGLFERPRQLRDVMLRSLQLPLYQAPQKLLNSAAQAMPVIILATFFDPSITGFYVLSRTLLNLPVELVATAVGNVLYPSYAAAFGRGETLRPQIIRATLALTALAAPLFLIIVVTAPLVIPLFFGEQWSPAAEFVKWMAVWLFFGFINRPSVVAMPVLGIQHFALLYEIISTVMRLTALVGGYYISADPVIAVASFSVVAAACNLALIMLVFALSERTKLP